MNRRSFLGRIGKAVAGAVIAAHMDLGSLVPIALPEVEAVRDYYSIIWPVIGRGWLTESAYPGRLTELLQIGFPLEPHS